MRPSKEWLNQMSPDERITFEEEWIAQEFTEELCRVLGEEASSDELARRTGMTRGYTDFILDGGSINLRRAAKIALALGYTISLSLEPA